MYFRHSRQAPRDPRHGGRVTKTASSPDAETADDFIERWRGSGGAERSNAQPFIFELCDLLSVSRPDPSQEETRFNDYVFERGVTFKLPDGTTSNGSIDCYKRDCFVLEAKQSSKRGRLAAARDAETLDFFGEDHGKVKGGTAKRGTRGWDLAMLNARAQAEDYAKALPREHGWPPFIVIVDVGHCIELYADFSRQGKNYAQFPDAKSFRIMLEDLADKDVRERLKLVWTAPLELDPSRRSAEVTRDIAERLAKIAKSLEAKHPAETVALFLMRCLFTMFAEDVELLPKDSFTGLLEDIRMEPGSFPPMMESLWRSMDKGEWDSGIRARVRRFNGQLFADCRALPLDGDQLNELYVAAKRDWRDVEPAIFGTLLERALNPSDRRKLGAHYTPRAYVERLVTPTIIEPLTADWRDVQAVATKHMEAGDKAKAAKAVRDFHGQLCATRVLDPACGTGNFLYVSMELMKRLEGEVLDFLGRIDAEAMFLEMKGSTVDPHQFLGLEINPRAVAIAELVLWLGFLKWQLRSGIEIADPVLKKFDPPNIREQDAILSFDRKELRRDERGRPVTRWDGRTMKKHPVTGEEVPDEDAQVEIYDYVNPRQAIWPEAEFIVGNPPFIGDKTMKASLGEGYVEGLGVAYSNIGRSTDFVLYWWARAATRVERGVLRRFGLITTNSFGQSFNRRLIATFVSEGRLLSIVYAVGDHPWSDGVLDADVRVSMTVCAPGNHTGQLWKDDRTTKPQIGMIGPNLKIGAASSPAKKLAANSSISCNGMMLSGRGFVLSGVTASELSDRNLKEHPIIRPYLNGRELLYGSENRFVIDAFDLSKDELIRQFPKIANWLTEHVLPIREQNNRPRLRNIWWEFAEPRRTFRPALRGISRVIATTETAKHRIFQFISSAICPDHMIVAIALDDAAYLAILSSRIHVTWALAAGGRLGVGNDPRYNKTVCFDPFPFPDPPPALKEKLRALGERL
ncbi:MAG TPA: SAM-dependent methyltransferase, partial [Parvularcula sp.]|nr:SAM-dependent methyltransferase [Parvularcula sp.]